MCVLSSLRKVFIMIKDNIVFWIIKLCIIRCNQFFFFKYCFNFTIACNIINLIIRIRIYKKIELIMEKFALRKENNLIYEIFVNMNK